jgi:hypothetical protein
MYCYISRGGKESVCIKSRDSSKCDRSAQGLFETLGNLVPPRTVCASITPRTALALYLSCILWRLSYGRLHIPLFVCLSGELRIKYSHRYESAAFNKRTKPATEYSQTESVWAAERDCYKPFTQSSIYQVRRNELSRVHEPFHYQTNRPAKHSDLEAAMSPCHFSCAHEYNIS